MKMKLTTILALAMLAQVIQIFWLGIHLPELELNQSIYYQDLDEPPPPPPQEYRHRCAINMYGLPRYFKDAVLPSLLANVIEINRHYNCDYYIHFFNTTFEPSGRSGAGGEINPEEALWVKPVCQWFNS